MTLRVEKNTSSNYVELKSKNDSIQYKSSMLYLPLNNPKSLVARCDGLVLETNGADVQTENNPEAIYNLFVTLGLKISKPDGLSQTEYTRVLKELAMAELKGPVGEGYNYALKCAVLGDTAIDDTESNDIEGISIVDITTKNNDEKKLKEIPELQNYMLLYDTPNGYKGLLGAPGIEAVNVLKNKGKI